MEENASLLWYSSPGNVTERLRQLYDLPQYLDHCPNLMEGWQYRAAFVIQFRPETDISAGVFNGRIEHVSSGHAARFHSLAELLEFITKVLEEVKKREQSDNIDQ